MFTQSISPLTSTAIPAAGTTQASPGFAAALASATSAPDPVDEEKALQELFHILASLSCGIVDYPAETKTGTNVPGPNRMEVERLKEVIRRLMTGNTGKHGKTGKKGDPDGVADQSLQELYQSLPPEIRNLLKRAFPKLEDLLRAESGDGTSSSS